MRLPLAALAVGSALLMPQERDPISNFVAEWRRMPVGAGTLDDLAHPPAFLARAADRRVREQVRAQMHAVHPSGGHEPFGGLPRTIEAPAPDCPVHDVAVDPTAVAFASTLSDDAMPARRGFRPALGWLSAPNPASPALDAPEELARLVASRLARDGLPICTAHALIWLAAHHGPPADDGAELRRRLDGAGVPTDLLSCLDWPDLPVSTADDVVRHLARAAAGSADAALRLARAARFTWHPTIADFEPFPDDGGAAAGLIRAQVARGNDWAGPGDGASIDVVRQLLALRAAPVVLVGVETAFAAGAAFLLANAATEGTELVAIAQPLPVSQWAQDAARLGRAPTGGDRIASAVLLPRWASRGEATSQLVAGDTLGGEALSGIGLRIARSPLVFQGGNLLVAVEPRSGARLLLVGEAEVRRNVALGLTPDQARAALRAEFGADRLVELATPSFHLDLDVSVRRVGDRLIAFVNDGDDAAARALDAGIGALQRAGRLGAAAADAARRAVARPDDAALGAALGPALAPRNGPALTLDLAAAFGDGAVDRGVANLQRFLAALDRFRAVHAPQRALPADPGLRGYFDAIRRGRTLERELRDRLRAAGIEVVAVPGLADGDRGISPVNMIQLPDRVLLTATGSLFESIDAAQREAVRMAIGPEIAVHSIVADETQRRSGGLHCAVQAGWSGKID